MPNYYAKSGAHVVDVGSSALKNLSNAAILAPMSGVSDLPLRRLARRLGASMVVSEMVASEDLAREERKVMRRAVGRDLDPFVVQLVGREARWMAEGAKAAEGLGAQVIDINMGCPSREVTGKLSGSALMRDLDHAESLVRAVTGAVSVPVTLKMRLGWDQKSRNASELARRAEAAGVAMITVHGRTRCQFFKGAADWSAVREVVDAVAVPVIVNGDIAGVDDARSALAASGAAGVMIGRGAYGAPWMPGRVAAALATGHDPGSPSLAAQGEIAVEHVGEMLRHYGTELGIRNARKHVGWYLTSSGCPDRQAKEWRRRLCTEESPEALLAGLAAFYGQLQGERGSEAGLDTDTDPDNVTGTGMAA